MQACQRRTIGGTVVGGGRVSLVIPCPRLWPPFPCTVTVRPPLFLLSSARSHPILCMPWLHGPGAILGCVWIGTRGCACSPCVSLSRNSVACALLLSTTRSRRHSLSLSLSLSLTHSLSLCLPPFPFLSLFLSRTQSHPVRLCFCPSPSWTFLLAPHRSRVLSPRVLFGPLVPSARWRREKRFMDEGDPRNFVKLPRRNYWYWATAYRHGYLAPPDLTSLRVTEITWFRGWLKDTCIDGTSVFRSMGPMNSFRK